MQIKTYPIGSYQTNCYMVWEDGSDSCILIDPGYVPEQLLEEVRRHRKTLEAILLTHGHFDHIGGVKKLAEETGCQVYIHADELKMPARMAGGEIYHTHTYAEGDVLTLAGLTLKVLHTPGHTLGCVCLLCGDVLFSGDTLFAGTCGRTDLPGGNHKTILESLRRLAALEGDLQVLPGHGPASSLDLERRFNPYMQERLW